MSGPNDEKLVRQLGAFGIWLIAVNGLIGAGIFGVPAGAAALTGAWSPLVFVACAVLVGAVIVCFAELAGHFRGTGGPILYISTAFGSFAGFQAGWAFYIARITAFAANVNLLVASIGFFWDGARGGTTRVILIAAIIGALAWVNIIGVRHAMRSIGVLTLLKFLPLVALVVVGAIHVQPAEMAASSGGFPDHIAFGTAALLVVYAFVGWEAAVVPAGEARDPARDMPRALFWALGLVTLLYVAVQVVSLAVLPDLANSERALVDVGAVLFGPAGALLITAGVVVSVGGNVASTMVTAPRLTYALAREGSMPAWFGDVGDRYRTPANSILFFAVIAFALTIYGSFIWLAAMSALVRVLIYMACIGAMPKLRHMVASPGGFRVPGGWSVPIGAFAVCGLLLLQVGLDAVLVTLAALAVGSIQYWWVRR